jgi:hypothetical protein
MMSAFEARSDLVHATPSVADVPWVAVDTLSREGRNADEADITPSFASETQNTNTSKSPTIFNLAKVQESPIPKTERPYPSKRRK